MIAIDSERYDTNHGFRALSLAVFWLCLPVSSMSRCEQWNTTRSSHITSNHTQKQATECVPPQNYCWWWFSAASTKIAIYKRDVGQAYSNYVRSGVWQTLVDVWQMSGIFLANTYTVGCPNSSRTRRCRRVVLACCSLLLWKKLFFPFENVAFPFVLRYESYEQGLWRSLPKLSKWLKKKHGWVSRGWGQILKWGFGLNHFWLGVARSNMFARSFSETTTPAPNCYVCAKL